MIKTIDNGVIRINGVSFLDFCSAFRGREIVIKGTNKSVPKFLLFWRGVSVPYVKDKYDLIYRK
jgi:hypothetical protein